MAGLLFQEKMIMVWHKREAKNFDKVIPVRPLYISEESFPILIVNISLSSIDTAVVDVAERAILKDFFSHI